MMKARFGVMLTAMIVSICMLVFSFIGGGIAYGAESPAGTDDFDYNGYSASQLKAISECIAGIPGKPCPSYSASTVDHYTGTVKHANMPTGVISTKDGWLKWADAAMKANSYDGVYGLVKLSSANDTTHSVKTVSSTIYFRLVGINHDDRADGRGKAGLTFQAIGLSSMPSYSYNSIWISYDGVNYNNKNTGGWRDSELRKSMNSGIKWKAFPSDFKDNVTSVNKITNNHADYRGYGDSNAISATADKLWILSPSEMGMPVSKKGIIINSSNSTITQSGADVHVFNSDNGRYYDTVKTTDDGNLEKSWYTGEDYLYSDDAYQWWMLPAGERKMSDGNQAYHDTDSYSYCAIGNVHNISTSRRPSLNDNCTGDPFWLRATRDDSNEFVTFHNGGYLYYNELGLLGIVPAFSF